MSVEGGKGFVYTSERGLAVTLANGQGKPVTMDVRLQPGRLGIEQPNGCMLHVEGRKPIEVRPVRRGGKAGFVVRLPGYGAGVLTLEGPARPGE